MAATLLCQERKRIVIPGIAHHVTQRGNYQQIVFEKKEDYQKYSYWINRYAKKYQVAIYSFCLMTNHVHFIVIPKDLCGLARLFNTVHMIYSQYKNNERKKTGHLWQARFYSCILSPQHFYRAARYIEMNPVRAKIVLTPRDYIWSSCRQHMGIESSPIIKTEHPGDMLGQIRDSAQWHYLNKFFINICV